MDNHEQMLTALKMLSVDVRRLIDLSMKETDEEWQGIVREGDVRCWEVKGCGKTDCPAFERLGVRCWLVAGTMCGGRPQGKFAQKFTSCAECDVYQNAIGLDPVTEIYEHIITLVHSLRESQGRLKAMATRDLLTGTYNRNYFNEVIQVEAERTKRYGSTFSILIADIDRFKQINDTFGHLHGDGILRECAQLLQRSLRSADLLVRFGGDEFLVLAPETDCAASEAIVARIRQELARWNEEYGSAGYQLSLSIGCAAYRESEGFRAVLAAADAAMYANKTRVSFSPGGR